MVGPIIPGAEGLLFDPKKKGGVGGLLSTIGRGAKKVGKGIGLGVGVLQPTEPYSPDSGVTEAEWKQAQKQAQIARIGAFVMGGPKAAGQAGERTLHSHVEQRKTDRAAAEERRAAQAAAELRARLAQELGPLPENPTMEQIRDYNRRAHAIQSRIAVETGDTRGLSAYQGLGGLLTEPEPKEPKPEPGFTLSPGGARFDAQGNRIASLPPNPPSPSASADPNERRRIAIGQQMGIITSRLNTEMAKRPADRDNNLVANLQRQWEEGMDALQGMNPTAPPPSPAPPPRQVSPQVRAQLKAAEQAYRDKKLTAQQYEAAVRGILGSAGVR